MKESPKTKSIDAIENIKKSIANDKTSHLLNDMRAANKVPTSWMYTTAFPDKGIPVYVSIDLNIGLPLHFTKFLKEEKGFISSFENIDFDVKKGVYELRRMVLIHPDGYMIEVETTFTTTKTSDTRVQSFLQKNGIMPPKDKNTKPTDVCYIDDVSILMPGDAFVDRETCMEFIKGITDWIRENDHKENKENEALIHMMVKDEYETIFKDFDVSKFTPELKDADIIYGKGFLEFSNDLLKRLETEKKGVVLFHGEPGTGKTTYIRYLLRELTRIDKRVIYVPPQMVDSMSDPAMMSFLTNNILDEARDTILLIEDAEPLLESRKNGGGRTTGITNLLNSTDGLLNDILGLVIIATFNTQLDKIDSALLRPGRLMARKEFKKMNYEQAQNVAKTFGVEGPFLDKAEKGKDFSIAQIFNYAKDKEILLHEVNEEKKVIGFK